jgi:hypothetical protein
MGAVEVYLRRPDKPTLENTVEFINYAENLPIITNIELDSLPKTGSTTSEKENPAGRAGGV